MSDWTEGYVSDIEYLPGVYVEQMPAHLDTICLLQGVEPPVREGEGFACCELGCGIGETALAVAAANSGAEVWGFDFNPAHIARAGNLAAAGRLDNIRFEDASFEQLAASARNDLPDFDYITLHGVWAWVSVENRRHILRFIDRHLKPGGLVYVTYNALPVWASAMPFQRLFQMYGSVDHSRSDHRILSALAMADEYVAARSGVLPEALLDRVGKDRDSKSRATYLSHEFLNEHWSPCYQMDVARDMATAKLGYVGSASILENFPDLSLNEERRAIVARAPPAFAETAKDFFLDRSFRRDVYVRGPRKIPERRLPARLRSKRLALVVPPHRTKRQISIPLGEAELNERFYKPALDALSEGTRTIGELLDLPDAAGSTASAREVLGMLVGSRQATVLHNDANEDAVDRTRAYNTAHLRNCADEGRNNSALAAAGSGTAIAADLFEMLTYEALAAGSAATPDALAQSIRTLLERRGDTLRFDGEVAEDPGKNTTVLQKNVAKVVSDILPIWRRIGVI